jgi:hypothetical protein
MAKPCIGNCNTEICEQNGGKAKCREEIACVNETNIKGPCSCEHKNLCNIKKQEDIILNDKTKEDCDFYKTLQSSRNGARL